MKLGKHKGSRGMGRVAMSRYLQLNNEHISHRKRMPKDILYKEEMAQLVINEIKDLAGLLNSLHNKSQLSWVTRKVTFHTLSSRLQKLIGPDISNASEVVEVSACDPLVELRRNFFRFQVATKEEPGRLGGIDVKPSNKSGSVLESKIRADEASQEPLWQ